MYSGTEVLSSRRAIVTGHPAAPARHAGRRGSAAVAKFKPFTPSLLLSEYRRAVLLNAQIWLSRGVCECSIWYLKFVGTAATAAAASVCRPRFTSARAF